VAQRSTSDVRAARMRDKVRRIHALTRISMTITHFASPPGIKAPPLSFATRAGDLLFISGIPGFDANGALPESFEAQFANVVTNLTRVLSEAGATTRHLLKLNVLLTRASDVATMNKLYADGFGPAPYPARTTCVVQALPDPKMLIEIEGVASFA
jgi:enamine deaminase RidA (YjgF/YER057c/UK114 family)